MIKYVEKFLKLEAASGILLILSAIFAMLCANTPLAPWYDMLLEVPVKVAVGSFEIAKPLLLWINDGLMALFFFLVGLELKREFFDGNLSHPGAITLPAVGAIGGMLVPALCYAAFNYQDPKALHGWAIPTATDIAFALGILTLLGSKVPLQLKVFLTSLAIFDDLGAIIIIALFYTEKLSQLSLIFAVIFVTILFLFNHFKVRETSPYIFVGILLWIAVLKSGVHATLAGVVLALFIPIKGYPGQPSPLKALEHNLHGMVAFIVLPIFAFANAGINLTNVGFNEILAPVPFGIIVGLLIGKQLGVFTFCYLAVKLGIAKLPTNVNWQLLYGVALLCGVGFTMSLFVGSLAFEDEGGSFVYQDRLGIIIGSLLSGVLGYLFIHRSLKKLPEQPVSATSANH